MIWAFLLRSTAIPPAAFADPPPLVGKIAHKLPEGDLRGLSVPPSGAVVLFGDP